MRIITLLIIGALLATVAGHSEGGKGGGKGKGGRKGNKGKGRNHNKGKGLKYKYILQSAPRAPVHQPIVVPVPTPYPVPQPYEVVKKIYVPFKVVEKVPVEVVRHVPYERIKYVPIKQDSAYGSATTYKAAGPPSYSSVSYSSPSFSSHSYVAPTYSLPSYSSSPYRRTSDTTYSVSSSDGGSISHDSDSQYVYYPSSHYVTSSQKYDRSLYGASTTYSPSHGYNSKSLDEYHLIDETQYFD